MFIQSLRVLLRKTHLPLHKGGLGLLEGSLVRIHYAAPKVLSRSHRVKKAPCAGIRFRIPGASREAGGGLFLLSFWIMLKSAVCTDNSSDTIAALGRATSFYTKEAYKIGRKAPFAQGGLLLLVLYYCS